MYTIDASGFVDPLQNVMISRLGCMGVTSFPEHLKLFWPPPEWLEDPNVLSLAQ